MGITAFKSNPRGFVVDSTGRKLAQFTWADFIFNNHCTVYLARNCTFNTFLPKFVKTLLQSGRQSTRIGSLDNQNCIKTVFSQTVNSFGANSAFSLVKRIWSRIADRIALLRPDFVAKQLNSTLLPFIHASNRIFFRPGGLSVTERILTLYDSNPLTANFFGRISELGMASLGFRLDSVHLLADLAFRVVLDLNGCIISTLVKC